MGGPVGGISFPGRDPLHTYPSRVRLLCIPDSGICFRCRPPLAQLETRSHASPRRVPHDRHLGRLDNLDAERAPLQAIHGQAQHVVNNGAPLSGRRLTTDPNAPAASPGEPASMSRRAGSPVYHGFVIVPETCTDGWCLGSITEFADPNGCDGGDAFVIAPDGSQAGLVWSVGADPLQEILPPDAERWGVYAISFPHPTRTVADLVTAFRAVLPQLKAKYAELGHAV